jgi:hypothetical protein
MKKSPVSMIKQQMNYSLIVAQPLSKITVHLLALIRVHSRSIFRVDSRSLQKQII